MEMKETPQSIFTKRTLYKEQKAQKEPLQQWVHIG
jgi:hypothetical protein